MHHNGHNEDKNRTILFELTTTFNKDKFTCLDDLTYSDNEPDDLGEEAKIPYTDRLSAQSSKVTFNLKKRIDIK